MSNLPPITRRTFVGAAATSAFAFSYIPDTVWGANDKVNLASIGCGGKGAGEVNDLHREGCNIVALCDVDQNRAKGTFKKHPNAAAFKDFRKMFDKMEKGIDAVTVSTPDHFHAIATVAALQLGKHCYTQKPLTHSVYEARVLQKLAKEKGVATQMGNQAHAGEPIRRAVEVVRAGIIGNVKEAHIYTNRPIWPQGMKDPLPAQPVPDTLDWNQWIGPAPMRDYNKSYMPFKWRGWWDFGTGALGDMACHIMDMAFWALELGSPSSFEAEQGGNTDQSPPRWSTVKYNFPARDTDWGGKQPPVTVFWYDGRKDGKQNFAPKDVGELSKPIKGFNPMKYGTILIGDKGKMFFNRGNTNWVIDPPELLENFKQPPKTVRRVKNEDAEWVEAIKGGPAALSNFDYSGPLTEMVVLGNLAIRSGEKVDWDGKNLKVTNNAKKAEQYIHREYRKGWSLGV
jgi:predicted dehydrogenase